MAYHIDNDDIDRDFEKMWIIIINRWRLVVIAGIIGTFLVGFISMIKVSIRPEIIPEYESATTMQVFLMKENNEQMKAALELTRSRTVVEKAARNLGLDMTTDELMQSISVENENDSNVLKIRVVNLDANRAREMADEIRETAMKFLNNSMSIRSFKVIEQANRPSEPISEDIIKEPFKNTLKRAIVGGVLAILGTIIAIFTQFALNDKIQTPYDIEKHLGQRVLTSIPMMEEQRNRSNGH